jgi:fasciclin domain-containing protein
MRRALLLAAIALAGCGGSDDEPPPGTVSGPLCQALPSGDDPGAPAQLVREPPDVALTWIPVVTTFEAAVRASRIELEGRTVLAPSDDAFAAAYDRQRLDDLLLERPAELVEPHVVEGTYSLAELRDAGEVTTVAGDTIEVTEAGAMARLDGRATTVCADYAAANARIHVIDGVLSN